MLDAFCHLHTPLPVSLTRDVIAIVLGIIFYLIAYALVVRPILRRVPAAVATNP